MTGHRKVPGISVEVPARLSAPGEGGVYAALFTHQLGAGGCMLKGMERIYHGRVIIVILDLDGFQVSAISRVFYECCEEGGLFTASVKFIDISPNDEMVLVEFVARRFGEISSQHAGPHIFSLTSEQESEPI